MRFSDKYLNQSTRSGNVSCFLKNFSSSQVLGGPKMLIRRGQRRKRIQLQGKRLNFNGSGQYLNKKLETVLDKWSSNLSPSNFSRKTVRACVFYQGLPNNQAFAAPPEVSVIHYEIYAYPSPLPLIFVISNMEEMGKNKDIILNHTRSFQEGKLTNPDRYSQ